MTRERETLHSVRTEREADGFTKALGKKNTFGG